MAKRGLEEWRAIYDSVDLDTSGDCELHDLPTTVDELPEMFGALGLHG